MHCPKDTQPQIGIVGYARNVSMISSICSGGKLLNEPRPKDCFPEGSYFRHRAAVCHLLTLAAILQLGV
jgi:hypothetical protein